MPANVLALGPGSECGEAPVGNLFLILLRVQGGRRT